MKDFCCKKCGCKEVFMDTVKNNTGLYCAECGKWIQWLNKDEIRLADRYIKNFEKEKNEQSS